MEQENKKQNRLTIALETEYILRTLQLSNVCSLGKKKIYCKMFVFLKLFAQPSFLFHNCTLVLKSEDLSHSCLPSVLLTCLCCGTSESIIKLLSQTNSPHPCIYQHFIITVGKHKCIPDDVKLNSTPWIQVHTYGILPGSHKQKATEIITLHTLGNNDKV